MTNTKLQTIFIGSDKLNGNKFREALLVLRVLNNKLNDKIIHYLEAKNKSNVTNIMIHLRLGDQGFLSVHLGDLREAGFVKSVTQGKERIYELNSERLLQAKILIVDLSKYVHFKETANYTAKEYAYNVLRAVSNTTRLSVLAYIEKHAGTAVTSIYKDLGMVQATCSFQLQILRDAGLVHTLRKGRNICYFLDKGIIRSASNVVDKFLISDY